MPLYKRCAGHDPAKCRHPWWYIFALNGQRYRRSTKTANRQSAERIEQRRRIAIVDGKDDELKDVSLTDHVKDYLAHTKKHNTTSYKDDAVLRRLKKSAGDVLVKTVSPFHIERWKQQRASEVSKSTVNRELNIVRGCFSRAVEWGRVATSPCKTVKPYEVDDVRIRVLDDDELRRVLTCDDEFVALVCRVTLECLPRLSEVLSMQRSHIGPTWIEYRRKGGSVTRAAVTPELRDLLLARCPADGDAFVFGGDRPPTEQAASLRIVRKLKELGVLRASHHTMRHTGVTLMLERGVNSRAIQALAGWQSLRMLERYGHARDAEIRRAVEGNAAYLQNLPNATTKTATAG